MKRPTTATGLLMAGLITVPDASASATVTVYATPFNPNAKSQWLAGAGPYTTITFTEFGLPSGTWLDEQYAYLGIHFTDGSDQIYKTDSFVTDQFGLNGAFDSTVLEFDLPITAIAVDFPGTIKFKLFSNGQEIFQSSLLGSSGTGFFTGLISTEPFDKVVMSDQGLFVDNLYFGPPIPAPGALTLLGIAALITGSRKRRE